MFKICRVCEVEKEIIEFPFRKDSNTYRGECRVCHLEKKKFLSKIYYQKNKDKLKKKWSSKEFKKRYSAYWKEYSKRPDVVDRKSLYWKSFNKSKHRINYKTQYREQNRERINKLAIEKRKNDILIRIKFNLSTRLSKLVKHQSNKFHRLIGCTPKELKLHLEKQFRDNMSWENYGAWHIDHIKPLSVANSKKELEGLCHFSNLQPLWAEENIKKSNKF